MRLGERQHAAFQQVSTIRTRRRPEALGRLDQNIRQKTSIAVSEQLRADKGENGNSRILDEAVSRRFNSSRKDPYHLVVVIHWEILSQGVLTEYRR